jgi:hypothetical protein
VPRGLHALAMNVSVLSRWYGGCDVTLSWGLLVNSLSLGGQEVPRHECELLSVVAQQVLAALGLRG